MKLLLSFACGLFLLQAACSTLFALTPAEVLVIANPSVPGSLELAQYYMAGRGIPAQNLLALRLSTDIVKRMIDDSLAAEAKGLTGTACFDARWAKPSGDKAKNLQGYALYDHSIHMAAERVEGSGRFPVVLDDKPGLFQPGQCPDAALYVGWHSLRKYIDAFTWQQGAVGYHIASFECETLRKKGSTVWCKRMLEEGAAATVGPVAEPYVQAFPLPEVFFGLLLEGPLSLAETYFLSLPFLSWQMVLLGDPLYRPFKNRAPMPAGG